MKMKLSGKTALITAVLVVITALAVGGAAAFIVSSDLKRQVTEQQNGSLRTAAVLLRKTIPDVAFQIAEDGKVSNIVLPAIPEFTSHEMIDEIGQVTGETVTVFAWEDESKDFWRKTTNIIKGDGKRAIGTPLGQKGRVYPYLTRGETYNGEATILGKDYYTIYEPIFSPEKKVIGILYAGVLKSKLDSLLNSILNGVILASVITAVAGIAVATVLTRMMLAPVGQLAHVMERLADNDMEVEVDSAERSDEVGDMARAVAVFKQNAGEKLLLERQQAETEKRSAEEQEQARRDLAENFESSVRGFVQRVSSSAEGMRDTAHGMSTRSGETLERAQSVASTSEQVATNVQTVSSATEELSTSIQEIGSQVSRTTQMASDAVGQAEKTNATISTLAESAQRIGEVVSLISDIADQTNLLALNATIEAARAGDAGKGFAVVASEVKSLATQTGKATEDISQQVTEIQSETQQAVEAIEAISKSINDMSHVITSISAAVEEQSSATEEIARNIQETSVGINEVNSNMGLVNQAANETGASSESVLNASESMTGDIGQLEQEVDRFVASMRQG